MALYLKNPALQDSLLRRNVNYTNAPAVKSNSDLMSAFTADQARSNIAGTNAQNQLDTGKQRLSLARKRFDFGNKQFGDEMGLKRRDFENAKSSSKFANLLGLGGVGLSGLGAYKDTKRNNQMVDMVDKMAQRYRDSGDENQAFIAEYIKMKYGR